jgi:hypothetical protein
LNNFEILPTEENLIQALQENLIQRNKDLVHLYNLLLAQESLSTIAIDGSWGSGKTFFVKQSILVINAKNPISDMDDEKREKIISCLSFGKDKNSVNDNNYDLAMYYDAWENDNDMDPVLSIIYEITKQLSITYQFKTDADLYKVAGGIIETISGRNVNGILNSLRCEDPLEEFKKQKELEGKFADFFTEILEERGNRLLVFIDELDRCKPSYAVHLLEQVKHYLCDERITFVFSVNLQELQHTIKHYYGNSFDACRYLDRFFNLRIALPPADKRWFYNKIGLDSNYFLERVVNKFIDNFHLELREICKYYRQVRAAAYKATHDNDRVEFAFPEGKGKQFVLMCVVPVVIGLHIVDISLYNDFIHGKNPGPLIDILDTEEFSDWIVSQLLRNDESFKGEENKKPVTTEQKITEMYKAIFVTDSTDRNKTVSLGKYQFDGNLKDFIISASGMFSDYADFEV